MALLAVTAGSPADFRGVSFTGELFDELVNTTRFFHQARFDRATFFGDTTFSGPYYSEEWASSSDAVFVGTASFRGATFKSRADFRYVGFRGFTEFDGAIFENEAIFDNAIFSDGVRFLRASFEEGASFAGVSIAGDADFSRSRFTGVWEGTVVCSGSMRLTRATVEDALRLQMAAVAIDCTAASFKGPVSLELRHARIDLTNASFGEQAGHVPLGGVVTAAVSIPVAV
ncbi:pentapeptide repeat-containing protein [Streptomyces sp. NPDC001537]